MGSGGSQTLWPPSYEAGVQREILEIVQTKIFGHHLAENQTAIGSTAELSMMVGFYKREQSN